MAGVEPQRLLERRGGARRVAGLAQQDAPIMMSLDKSRVELQCALDTRERMLGVAGGFLCLGQRVVGNRVVRRNGDRGASVCERSVRVPILATTCGEEQVRRGA